MSRSVVVVGGGVIGLCAAHALRAAGCDVAVVERDRCGAGASSGNAGWVTPSLSGPLPAPGVLRQALRWMADADSPLLVRPRLDPAFLAWSARFMRSCSARAHDSGLRATWALARRALPAYDRLRAAGVPLEHHASGLLFLTRTAAAMAEWDELFRELRALGYEHAVTRYDGDALRDLEPAVGAGVAAGLLAEGERHVRPESLCDGLRERLLADGVELREGMAVDRLEPRGHGWRAHTAAGPLDAHVALVAAGVWTPGLLAPLGVRLRLEAAKGYSITADAGAGAPRRPLYLTEIKAGLSPFDGAVRLAGTLELAGIDLALRRRRVEAIVNGAAGYLADWRPRAGRVDWAGLRPLTPDGVPVVGAVPGRPGLLVATGHGMLGVTLAPSTAEALVGPALGEPSDPGLAGLGPERFLRSSVAA